MSIERAIITRPGIVRKINGLEDALKVPGIAEIFIDVKPGDKVAAALNVEKAGHIIAVGNTLAEAEESVVKCRELLSIEVFDEGELSMEAIRIERGEIQKNLLRMQKLRRQGLPDRRTGHGRHRHRRLI